ncbi:hypothetical protein K458DRAFT_397386 [Lentithecium fluviatile CBS 122367]|uniref:Uncharacterized protein n=1 Tax=Lentithecium fluviatile CBS 122367 TaxID=1168545 RepID=A0A6G1ID03_9PLEO|nr:hypothetical protein K458DRAFT_397386 [Lentithecium fluviatile CBS 122367]
MIEYLRDPRKAATVEELVYIEVYDKPHYSWRWGGEEVQFIGLGDDAKQTEEESKLVDSFTTSLSLHSTTDCNARYDPRDLYFRAAVAIFFALCPNIHTFHSNFFPIERCSPENPLETFLIRNNHGQLPKLFLQNLRHLHFVHNHQRNLKGFEQKLIFNTLRLFHRLPNIESFHTEGISANDDTFTILLSTSNISKLFLDHVEVGSYDFAQLIRSSKRLEEVCISIGGKSTNGRGSILVHPKTIGKALLCHKKPVRMLDLDYDAHIYDNDYNGWGIDEEDIPEEAAEEWLTSEDNEYIDFDIELSAKPKYTHDLRQVGIKMLIGDKSMPTNIETLIIRGYRKAYNKRYDWEVARLLEIRNELFPRLKIIKGIEEEVPNTNYADSDDEGEDQNGNEGMPWWKYWEARDKKFEWTEVAR